MTVFRKSLLTFFLASTMLACASKPVLIPNAKYNRTGHEAAERDIDKCMKEADVQLEKTKNRRIVRSAATGAVIGSVIGAATSSGGNFVGHAVGGAVVGGAAGAVSGAVETPEGPKRGLVNYCLRQKGYQIAGWD